MKRLSTFAVVPVLLACIAVGAGGEEPENMIQNGGFEAQFQNWLWWSQDGAVAERQTLNKKVDPIDGENVAYVQIGNGGNNFNSIQFYQGPFVVKKGKYTFCLWGRSDEQPRPVRLSVLQHALPFTRYIEKDVAFNESWDEYAVTYTQAVDDGNVRISIYLGAAGVDVDVWLDHVRLYEGEYFNDGVRELPGQQVDIQDKLAVTWGKVKLR